MKKKIVNCNQIVVGFDMRDLCITEYDMQKTPQGILPTVFWRRVFVQWVASLFPGSKAAGAWH